MSRTRIASAGLLALLAAGAAAQELHAPDATVGDRFGWSVAVSGERLLVGVLRDDDRGRDSGSAWVFELGEEGWGTTEKLLASNGRVGAQFGHDVALSGDLAVVGAPGMGFQGERVGRAYVFERGPEDQDLSHDRRIGEEGDEPARAAAVRASQNVDREHAAQRFRP